MELDDICSEKLLLLFKYWRGTFKDSAMPGIGNIDPLEFDYAMGMISLVEVHRDPLRFYFRHFGAHNVDHYGFDLTGKWLDDNPEKDIRIAMSEWCCTAITSQAPVLRHFDEFQNGQPEIYETLVLPLADNTGQVQRLLLAIDYGYKTKRPEVSLAS